ncbi:MAG: hypothetical protein RQ801_01290 [Spirochaetaceae bacterium]|nr:hypothetical protein [Spirochaetaceae bacterium]MDT8296905.1 hypothetical protein [Spirochaetaceae bacterium]
MKEKYESVFGDLHNHCNISYGHGDLNHALENAALRLDFVSITGHADWPDMDANNPEIAHIVDFHVKGFARLKKIWDEYLDRIREFETQRHLVTYPGYEIHSNEHGDYTIVGREHRFPMTLADSPDQLRSLFRNIYGPDESAGSGGAPPVLMFPHHIGYRQGARGVNWESFNEAYTPLVEIYSMHGLADDDFSDKPSLHSMGPWQSCGTMVNGLRLGKHFGVIGNTDHHSGHPGSYGHGLTGAWTKDRDRSTIWDALYARRTWAMTGDLVRLWFSLGEVPMGGTVSAGLGKTGLIDVDATTAIDYVELLVRGERRELWWSAPEHAAHEEALFQLELGWGERHKATEWDVDIQVENGSVLEEIPRFRGLEVVSPLDSSAQEETKDRSCITYHNSGRIRFQTTSLGNATNTTPSTQGIALRISDPDVCRIAVTMNGRHEAWSIKELLQGSRSGNLGPIDSPAFRVSAISPDTYKWKVPCLLDIEPGDWIHVRVRLKNGHWAISSPIRVD